MNEHTMLYQIILEKDKCKPKNRERDVPALTITLCCIKLYSKDKFKPKNRERNVPT